MTRFTQKHGGLRPAVPSLGYMYLPGQHGAGAVTGGSYLQQPADLVSGREVGDAVHGRVDRGEQRPALVHGVPHTRLLPRRPQLLSGGESCVGVFSALRGTNAANSRVIRVPAHFSLADILVLAGGAILPVPVVPASTRISARLKCVGNTVHL